ncbi:MAG: hypothetical protein IKZ82_05635 [Clostridia bacterium]|nr:hypothetical protein [Clostridia bacterium]
MEVGVRFAIPSFQITNVFGGKTNEQQYRQRTSRSWRRPRHHRYNRGTVTLTTDVIADGIALILGVVAILLGIKARKLSGKGLGAIIVGALAVILAVFMTVSSISAINLMKTEAEKKNLDIAKYIDKPLSWLMGIITSLPKDEETLNALVEQFNSLSETSGEN